MNAASPSSSPAVGGDFKRLLLLAGIIPIYIVMFVGVVEASECCVS